jgi:outer membrane protein assembly factor BamB
VWKTPLENYPMYGDFGTGASPALAGNLLIICSDNEKQQFIAAFDKKTGRQVWRTNRDITAAGRRTAWSTPYLWTTPGRTEVVTTGPGFSISYDLTGRELWRMGGVGGGPISSPSAAGGLLYLNGGSGGVFAAIRPGAAGVLPIPKDKTPNAFVAWALERAGTGAPTHLTYDGAVYSLNDTGILSRYDAATGTLTYRARIEGGTAFTSSPWASDGKIFCLNEEGRTFVVAAGPEYKLLRSNDLDEFTLATPALVGDRLILRTESQLYSIRQRK